MKLYTQAYIYICIYILRYIFATFCIFAIRQNVDTKLFHEIMITPHLSVADYLIDCVMVKGSRLVYFYEVELTQFSPCTHFVLMSSAKKDIYYQIHLSLKCCLNTRLSTRDKSSKLINCFQYLPSSS